MYNNKEKVTVQQIMDFAAPNIDLGGIAAASHVYIWDKFLESWSIPSTSVCSNYYDPQLLVPKF